MAVHKCLLAALAAACMVGTARAEDIALELPPGAIHPGDTFSILFLLQDNSTPLFGYSLEVDVFPKPKSVGSITVDIALTNFFDERNLITAGGATRDPDFSVIFDTGDGGVFISTNTDDGSGVLAVDGVNDVLAQVFFNVSDDAAGDFLIDLGPGSALSDLLGNAVPFTFTPARITVTGDPCDPCDMDCDGDINAFDIEPFLDLLFDPNAQPCAPCTGDVDGNGEINAFDIEPFLECLFP